MCPFIFVIPPKKEKKKNKKKNHTDERTHYSTGTATHLPPSARLTLLRDFLKDRPLNRPFLAFLASGDGPPDRPPRDEIEARRTPPEPLASSLADGVSTAVSEEKESPVPMGGAPTGVSAGGGACRAETTKHGAQGIREFGWAPCRCQPQGLCTRNTKRIMPCAIFCKRHIERG